MVPQVLPWLAILALLVLKPNRCASAWWIWLPLGCVAGVAAIPQSVLQFLPSDQYEIFLEWISALGFGVAAVWLVSSYLGWKHRLLAFLGVLVVQVAFSLFTYLVRQGGGDMGREVWGLVITLLISGAVIAIAITLAGLLCRKRYGALRVSLWLLVALTALWVLPVGVVAVIAVIASDGQASALEFLVVVPIATGISFGVLLPFLILSFANGLYRERLKALLHLGGTAPPPVIGEPVPAVPEPAEI
jgi:hypothetical protein